MTPEAEVLIVNRITARPDVVYAILSSVHTLHRLGEAATSAELKQFIAKRDMGEDQWYDNVAIALEMGVLVAEDGKLAPRSDFMAVEEFKRFVRRRFQEYEARDSNNALIARAFRVALGMPLDGGTIDVQEFVNHVERQLGTEALTEVRRFNREKAGAWLHWMRYLDLAVGSPRFAPVLSTVARRVVEDERSGLERDTDLAVREFLTLVEQEAPCVTAPAAEAESGQLPAATAAMLVLLEEEGMVRLETVGDAPRWSFPGTGQPVTHVHVLGAK